jgi:hypothetical protein
MVPKPRKARSAQLEKFQRLAYEDAFGIVPLSRSLSLSISLSLSLSLWYSGLGSSSLAVLWVNRRRVIAMIRQFSTVNFPSKSWLVVGGGPCGIGVTGKLVDLGQQVAWIDPAFEVGRMGPYYRNVPANTPNGDLIKAFRLSPTFEFDELQLKRKLKGEVVMSDLELDRCHSLSTFVDALEDATTVLKNKVHRIIQGGMKSIHLSENGKWRCFTDSNVTLEEVDAVVLTNGCHPRWLPPFPTVEHSQQPKRSIVKCNKTDNDKVVDFYSLDLMVDPLHCREQLSSLSRTSSKWAVVGNSHSGMLVVKNLIEAGFTNVVNFHRSPLKFMHTNERGVVK